ncbi:MAG: glycosyltransferase family 39 protein [Janthinobacterium lividum]
MAASNSNTAREQHLQNRLILILLGLGFFFRLFHFFNNRSFFTDEITLSVSLIKLNFWQLATQPLAYEQKAPLGYLWASRLCVLVLGKQEQALRLFPLLCGLGGLVYFVPVARYFLRAWGTVLAVGLLALAYPAMYHAVEAKQYSTELFATVLALYLYINYHQEKALRPLLLWGVLGGLLLWFSFSTVFVLAGMGGAICLTALLQRDWKRFATYLIPCALWLLSFGILYVLFVSKYHKSEWLTYFFKIRNNAYLPITEPAAALQWLAVKFYAFLDHPLGMLLDVSIGPTTFTQHFFKLGWLSIPMLCVGAYSLGRRHWQWFLVFFLPFVLTLAASAVTQYPFHERLTLFLLPIAVLVLAYGTQQVGRFSPFGFRLMPLLLFLLLAIPLANMSRQAIQARRFYNQSYYREMLLYVNDRVRAGDGVYVYWNMRPAYEYYKEAYHLKYTAVEGSYVKNKSVNQADYLRNLQPDFISFKGKKRLWYVYDVNIRDAIGDFVEYPAWYFDPNHMPGILLNNYFSSLGKQIDYYHKNDFSVTLFELK